MSAQRVSIDLRHDQWNLGIHAESTGLVDDNGSGGGGQRANSLAWAAPAEKKAISMPLNEAGPSLSTGMDPPLKVTVFPTERSDAYTRSVFTGNLL
jgi:hypothetical protein